MGEQIARGLAAARTCRLIHRDIKPGNILLEEGIEQKVKITDFGLARAVDDASLTQSGVIAGTPLYMARSRPERIRFSRRSCSAAQQRALHNGQRTSAVPCFDSPGGPETSV